MSEPIEPPLCFLLLISGPKCGHWLFSFASQIVRFNRGRSVKCGVSVVPCACSDWGGPVDTTRCRTSTMVFSPEGGGPMSAQAKPAWVNG